MLRHISLGASSSATTTCQIPPRATTYLSKPRSSSNMFSSLACSYSTQGCPLALGGKHIFQLMGVGYVYNTPPPNIVTLADSLDSATSDPRPPACRGCMNGRVLDEKALRLFDFDNASARPFMHKTSQTYIIFDQEASYASSLSAALPYDDLAGFPVHSCTALWCHRNEGGM
jgi:hypothetical protein